MRLPNNFRSWPCVHRDYSAEGIFQLASRFKFLSNGYAVPCLFVPNDRFPNRLLVTLNGAVKREEGKDPREVFQRRTWIDAFDANVLMISDATLHPENKIQIGWAQGNGSGALISAMASSVEFIRDALDLDNQQVVFFGSSAGGFQAVALHGYFPGSRFLVNNAQFDWTLYHPTHVQRISDHSYDGLAVEVIRKEYAEMSNVFSRFLKSKLPISGGYMVNVASPADYKKQLPVLTSFMTKRAKTQPSVGMDISVKYYADPKAGHMPMPKQNTLKQISRYLEAIGNEGATSE